MKRENLFGRLCGRGDEDVDRVWKHGGKKVEDLAIEDDETCQNAETGEDGDVKHSVVMLLFLVVGRDVGGGSGEDLLHFVLSE